MAKRRKRKRADDGVVFERLIVGLALGILGLGVAYEARQRLAK